MKKTIISFILLMFLFFVYCAGIVSAKEVKAIKLNRSKLTLYVGDEYRLKLKNCTKKLTWTSKDTCIATVSKKGVVQAVSDGKTTITVKNDGKKYKCKIIIKNTTGGLFSSKTYSCITDDMTYSQVIAVLGAPDKCMSKSEFPSCPTLNTYYYSWEQYDTSGNLKGTANIMFQGQYKEKIFCKAALFY